MNIIHAAVETHFPEGFMIHDEGVDRLPIMGRIIPIQVVREGSSVIFTTDDQHPIANVICSVAAEKEGDRIVVEGDSFDLLLVFQDNVLANFYHVEGDELTSETVTGPFHTEPDLEVPRLFEPFDWCSQSLKSAVDSVWPIEALSAQMCLASMQWEDGTPEYPCDALRDWWGQLSEEDQRRWIHFALETISWIQEGWEEILEHGDPNHYRLHRIASQRAHLHDFCRITQNHDLKQRCYDLDMEIDVTWFKADLVPLPKFDSEIISEARFDWFTLNMDSEFDPWWYVVVDDFVEGS